MVRQARTSLRQAEVNPRQLGGLKREASGDDDDDEVSVLAPPCKKSRCVPETIDLSD